MNHFSAEASLSASSDAALVTALIEGSQHAASAIWHRHAPAVRAMLQRSLGPDQEIDDLVQEVFIGFVRSPQKLLNRAILRSYLVAIAFRTAAMEIRRRKVRRRVGLTRDGEVPDTGAAPTEPDERRALQALSEILNALPTRERLVFVARHVEGLEIEEAARLLKLSKATVWRAGKSSLENVVQQARRSSVLAGYVTNTMAEKQS